MSNRYETAVAGALAGVFAVTVSYPFDLVKTRMQFIAGDIKKQGAQDAVPPAANTKGLNMLERARAAAKTPTIGNASRLLWAEGATNGVFGMRGPVGGVLSFYRGLDQLVPESAFKVLFRFVAFKEVQNAYRSVVMGLDDDTTTPLPVYANLVCGAFAGFVEAALIVQPFERGKTLRADFASPYAVWGRDLRRGGVGAMMRSVYTGFVPCAGRQIGNQAVSFTVFYTLKSNWLEHKREGGADVEELNTVERMGFGFLGGVCGATTTMPLDTAKTIAQKQQGETRGTLSIIRDVVARKGVRGLYVGLAPRLGRVGIDRACGFLAFEWIMEQVRKYKKVSA